MTYGDFKDLPRRTTSEKVLHDTAFNISKNPKYQKCDEYQRRIVSMFYKFFNKKSSVISNQCPLDLACVAKVCDRNQKELAEELRKSIIRNLKSEKCTHLLKKIFRVLI